MRLLNLGVLAPPDYAAVKARALAIVGSQRAAGSLRLDHVKD